MQRNNAEMIIKSSPYVSFKSSATVEPRQRISSIYIYLYVSDQSVFIGARGGGHFPLVLMNRLNKTESAVFIYCRFSIFPKDPFFQII